MNIELKITLSNGQVGVSGPLENKLLCLGLLELAKVSVMQYDPDAILVPKATIIQ